jgi:hypothetical protein
MWTDIIIERCPRKKKKMREKGAALRTTLHKLLFECAMLITNVIAKERHKDKWHPRQWVIKRKD